MDIKLLKQLSTAASKVVTGKAGLFEGCLLVRAAIVQLNHPDQIPQAAVAGFLSNVPRDWVTGDSLLYIDDSRLTAAISQMAQLEAQHRVAVTLECRAIYAVCRKVLADAAVDPQR